VAFELLGVKVYVVVAWLFIASDQLPEIPFRDVVGNGDNAAPAQIEATCINVGTIRGFTTIVIVAVFAH
jgi:hypothetical protein